MSTTTSFRRVTIEIPLHSSPDDRSPAGIKIVVDGADKAAPEQMPLPLAPMPGAGSADAFVSEWLAGKLPIQVQPILSMALFEVYEQSCFNTKNQPVDQKEFIRAIRRGGVSVGIGRFMQSKRLRQARVLLPPGAVRPPGMTRTDWLTKHVEAFDRMRPNIFRGSGEKT